MLGRFLNAKFVSASNDTGLLLLRIGTGLILFIRHGWEKVSLLSLSNPLSRSILGLPHNVVFVISMIGDGIFSLLLVLGVGTRWISLYCFAQIFVAWAFAHHFAFLGHAAAADHGELIALYLSAFLALMFTGAGRFSVDALLLRNPKADRV